MADKLQILLVEPEALLRRTVAMTARSFELGQVHEAASAAIALSMARTRSFDGAVIAVDCVGRGDERHYDLALVDRLRDSETGERPLQIAIMTREASPALLQDLRERRISRVILKPFRAKVLLETIANFQPGAAGAR